LFRPLTRKHCAGLGIPGLALVCTLAAASAHAQGYFSDQLGVNNDLFGFSMSELEDSNTDGADEFLVGAPGDNFYAGKVFFWYGGPWVTAIPPVILTGVAPEQFGRSVARIGDVNNDGRDDFAVGAPMSNAGGAERGRVYVFFGGSLTSGPAATAADLIIAGEDGGDRFGWSVSAAGDFDGDGHDDFIVGAPLSDNTGANAGSAYVIYGAGSSGPSTDLADATVLNGLIAEDRFGWSVSDAGNFLAGSENCVAVGAPGNNAQGADAGAVYVFEGCLGCATPDAVADFTAIGGATNKANSQYGYAVRNAGRWSGDSLDDLAIGAPLCDDGGAESGRVEIIFGASSPVATGDRYVAGEAASDSLGLSLARVGDVLGTSNEDLLIGAPGSDQSGSRAGRAYIYHGGQASQVTAAGLDPYPNVPLRPGTAPDDLYGRTVASAGDFDGDGLADFAVAAPNGSSQTEVEETGAISGFVHLLHSSTGPVAAEMQSWRAAWVPSGDRGQVDLAFALAEPVDNIARLDLNRRVRDARGRLVSETAIWSGPAQRDASGAGVLTTDGRAYRFVDPGPAAPPTGGALSYAVTAATQDGRTLALQDLAGPSEAAPSYGLAVSAFPNPSRAQVSLSFRALDGDALEVNVFDVRGRLVRHLLSGAGTGAWMETTWDGRNEAGQPVAEGVYFLCAHSSEGLRSRRLTLVR